MSDMPEPEMRHSIAQPDCAARDLPRLRRIGGELLDKALEWRFQQDRFAEMARHCRMLMIASAVLNALFLIGDWRFAGTSQFWVAVPARCLVIAIALVCLVAARRMANALALRRLMLAWMLLNTAGVAALVTSHSMVALLVIFLLPMIYYLVLPFSFRAILATGLTSSLVLLIAFDPGAGGYQHVVALVLVMILHNCAMALTVTRNNRLARLEWLATRKARAMATELEANRETLARMFQCSPVPMLVTDMASGRLIQINEGAVALFGENPLEAGDGTLNPYYTGADDRQRMIDAMDEGGGIADIELRIRTGTGTERIVMVKSTAVETPQGRVIMAGLIDISDQRAIELSLEWLASTDPLTRLPNRNCFFGAARAEIRRAARENSRLALLMIDLDHFKAVNDTFGHQGGDRALKAFADLCLARLRDYDVIGRLGGEEFGILLPGADMAGALTVGETLRACVEALRFDDMPDIRLTASFGVSPVYAHETDLDTAMSRADTALYAAKHAGRNRVVCNTGDSAPLPLRRTA